VQRGIDRGELSADVDLHLVVDAVLAAFSPERLPAEGSRHGA